MFIKLVTRVEQFWKHTPQELIETLSTSAEGLSDDVAFGKLQQQKNRLKLQHPWIKDLLLLLSQYKNPLVLLLVFAVLLSTVLGEYPESIIILTVLLLTGILGFFQERNAGKAVEKLRQLVHNKATVKRGGAEKISLLMRWCPVILFY